MVITSKLYLFLLEKAQLKKLEIPSELLPAGESYSMVQSTIYVHTQSANGIKVNQYDIEKEEWGKEWTFELPPSEDKMNQPDPYIKIMNGKIYIIRSTNSGHTLFIGDAKTGEYLYEGKLNVKNQRGDQKEYRLYINEVESH